VWFSALCYNRRNGPCDLRGFANSPSSWSPASSVSHSPRTMPHLGQSIRNPSSPLSCDPNVKFGGVLHVEQTKISVPFRAFIPERCNLLRLLESRAGGVRKVVHRPRTILHGIEPRPGILRLAGSPAVFTSSTRRGLYLKSEIVHSVNRRVHSVQF